MWCGRRGALLAGGVAGAALACVLVLWFESRRASGAQDWPRLSAGIGLGSQAGVELGFFAYDARLESMPESAFETLPGSAIDSGACGVLVLAPISR